MEELREEEEGEEEELPEELRVVAEEVGWEFMLKTKDSYYFKSAITRKLDEALGDVGGKIADLENELILEIEGEVLENAVELVYISDILAELDCHFCYALVAK